MPKFVSRSKKSNRLAAVCSWEELAVGELKPAAQRTRSHAVHKRRIVEASIIEYGILDPITVNSHNIIVDGHLRYEIALKLELRTVPVIRIDHMNDAELRAYALAANKLPATANYDVEALRLEFEAIEAAMPTLDFTLTGFTIGEVDRIKGNHAANLYDDLDETDEAIPKTSPKAQRGDLYALGDHRLICGDTLDSDTLSRLMDGDEARCGFTDPPYNVRINGHVSGSGVHSEFAMASGEMSHDQFVAFLQTSLGNLASHLCDGAIAYVCMDHAHIGELIAAGAQAFDERLNICVWDKGQGGMGALYRSQHELVAVFKKGSAPHLNNVALGKNGRNRSNVWSFPGMGGFGKSRKKALDLHPTVKPVALVAEALLDVTAPGDIVLDPFAGSGSTLIAAQALGRRARLVEYDPVYVDRIIARWERLTQSKAQLLNQTKELDK